MLVPVIRAAGSTKAHRGSAIYDGTPAIPPHIGKSRLLEAERRGQKRSARAALLNAGQLVGSQAQDSRLGRSSRMSRRSLDSTNRARSAELSSPPNVKEG